MKMKYRTQLLTEQQELVRRLHKEEGMTYRQIAEGLKLSRARVRQIAAEARRRLEEYEEDPRQSFVLLPARVRTMLENFEYRSRSEVLEAVKSGRLYYDAKKPYDWLQYQRTMEERKQAGINFARLRNVGRQSWEILLQWLGLPIAAEPAEPEELAKKTVE